MFKELSDGFNQALNTYGMMQQFKANDLRIKNSEAQLKATKASNKQQPMDIMTVDDKGNINYVTKNVTPSQAKLLNDNAKEKLSVLKSSLDVKKTRKSLDSINPQEVKASVMNFALTGNINDVNKVMKTKFSIADPASLSTKQLVEYNHLVNQAHKLKAQGLIPKELPGLGSVLLTPDGKLFHSSALYISTDTHSYLNNQKSIMQLIEKNKNKGIRDSEQVLRSTNELIDRQRKLDSTADTKLHTYLTDGDEAVAKGKAKFEAKQNAKKLEEQRQTQLAMYSQSSSLNPEVRKAINTELVTAHKNQNTVVNETYNNISTLNSLTRVSEFVNNKDNIPKTTDSVEDKVKNFFAKINLFEDADSNGDIRPDVLGSKLDRLSSMVSDNKFYSKLLGVFKSALKLDSGLAVNKAEVSSKMREMFGTDSLQGILETEPKLIANSFSNYVDNKVKSANDVVNSYKDLYPYTTTYISEHLPKVHTYNSYNNRDIIDKLWGNEQ